MSVPIPSSSPLSSGGSPVVNRTLEPAWVRDGSTETQKAYETALAFEQMLVEQLSQSLTASSGLGGEESESGESGESGSPGSSAASGPISSMLPQALTSGVMNDGGLGLAAQMTRELQNAPGSTPAGTIPADTAPVGTSGNSGAIPTGGTITSVGATTPTSSDPDAVGNLATTGGTSS